MNQRRTTIVIPCYNEAERLPADSFVSFLKTDDAVDFVFVDDGSTDTTFDVLESLCARDARRLRWVRLEANGGKAEAVRRGMLTALEQAPAYAGYWDADLATPLDVIPIMRRVLEADEELIGALGSRVRLLGRQIERRAARHYLGRLMATAASLVLRMPVYDTQCGAKLFRSGPLTGRLFDEPFTSRWLFDVEILARLAQAYRAGTAPRPRSVLVEVPLDRWHDVGGSKMVPTQMAGAAIDLLRIAARYRD